MPTADCNTPAALSFARIPVAPLIDDLCTAVDAARTAAAGNQRWLNAIDTAWDWILSQDSVSFDRSTHALRVPSASEAGRFYVANGECSCRAFETHAACWHRAASRLVVRGLELQAMNRASSEAAEVDALAGELYADAEAAGDAWYTVADALAGARSRLPGLLDFAAEWDRDAADMRAAALGARIARAALAVAA
jgi:hypothetical protein